MDLKCVLTIAGSDSSGGAGIQADLKTVAAHLLYGASAVTALTAQNTVGVSGVFDVPPAFVTSQIDAVFEDIRPAAVKVGMVSTAANVRAVAACLDAWDATNVVVDPVMVSTSGASLMADDARAALVSDLFPRAAVVTPNVPEASVLAGFDAGARGVASMVEAARAIAALTPGAVLVKGGHLTGDTSCDVLLLPGAADPVVFESPRVATANTHGTGCTLSSAIACGLAQGLSVAEAVRRAKDYVQACLSAGLDLGRGNGPLDHMASLRAACSTAVEKPVPPTDGVGGPCGSQTLPASAGTHAGQVGAVYLPCGEGTQVDPPCTENAAASVEKAAAASPILTLRRQGLLTRVLVVGGAPHKPSPALVQALALQSSLVVACDSGVDACQAAGVQVDVLIGDSDSATDEGLAFAREHAQAELAFPAEKDDVDLGLALGWIAGNVAGPVEVTLTGVTGGRLDHQLAVLGLAARSAGMRVSIEEDDATMRVLSPEGCPAWELGRSAQGRTLSVVPLLGPAEVSEHGMQWEADRLVLAELDDQGVSNVVAAPDARIEVHAGTALAILLRTPVTKAR